MILLCCASELGLPEDLSAIEVILYYYYYYYWCCLQIKLSMSMLMPLLSVEVLFFICVYNDNHLLDDWAQYIACCL